VRKPKGTGRTFLQASRLVPPSEKAAFHQVSGAGRSHVKREFFGLTEDDETAIVAKLDTALRQQLKG
jgi:phage gpG-like protein